MKIQGKSNTYEYVENNSRWVCLRVCPTHHSQLPFMLWLHAMTISLFCISFTYTFPSLESVLVHFQWQQLLRPSSSPVTFPTRQDAQNTGFPLVMIVFCTRQLFLQAFLVLKMATKPQMPCSKHSCSGYALSVLLFHPLITSCLTRLTPTHEVSLCVEDVKPTVTEAN